MKHEYASLSFRTAIFWFFGVIVIAGLGTYLTYNEPLTTGAWQHWKGSKAWILDVLRLLVLTIAAFYILWLLGNLRVGPLKLNELRMLFPRDRIEWAIFILASLVFIGAVFFWLPDSFENTMQETSIFSEGGYMADNTKLIEVHEKFLKAKENPVFDIWTELRRPAIPYFFYELGLCFGVVWTVFVCVMRNARRDWRFRNKSIADFNRQLPTQPFTAANATTKEFDVLLTAFHLRSRGLRDKAKRYLSVLLVLVLCIVYETSTMSHGTTLPETLDVAKFVVWVFLGPVFFIFLVVVITGYHHTVEQVRNGIDLFIVNLTESGANSDLLDKAIRFDDELITSKSGLAFSTTILKSSSIAIPLLISILGYVIQELTGGKWLNVFIPQLLIDFITDLYTGF